LATIIFLIVQLRLIVVPVLIAVLIAALLLPLVSWLMRHRVPHALSIVMALLLFAAIVTGLVYVVVWQLNAEYAQLQERTIDAYHTVSEWLRAEPFNITDEQLNQWVSQASDALEQDSSVLLSGAASVGSTIGHFVTGLLLALFSLIVLLV